MANVVYKNNAVGVAEPQRSTDGAGHVQVEGGAVAIDQSVPGYSNNHTLSPNPSLGTSALNATTAAYAASIQVKAGAGKFFGGTGYNSKGSAQWIQLHDSATLPANGAIPKLIFTVATVANFSLDIGIYGRAFQNGIYVVNSTTGPTLTLGSADCWFDIQYL